MKFCTTHSKKIIRNELLGAEELDINFSCPDEYVEFLPRLEELDDTSWWLIGTSKGFFLSCFNFLNVELKSEKNLIPFAKSDAMNILACFDLDKKTYFYELEKRQELKGVDWDKIYYLEDFSEWLGRVKNGKL